MLLSSRLDVLYIASRERKPTKGARMFERFTGNPGSPFRVIGTATLLQPQRFIDRSFETASNWMAVTCQPQTVLVRSNGYWVCLGFDGVVTDEHFVNRLFHSTSIAPKRSIGQPRKHSIMFYAYELGKVLNESDSSIAYSLDPGYRAPQVGTYDFNGSPRYELQVAC